MRLHKFIGDFDLSHNSIEVRDPALINQISKVLRLNTGDLLMLADGQLHEAKVKIISLNKKAIMAEIIEKTLNDNEPKRIVSLYCAILKRENFELVAQKATEAGITKIIPLITERTIKTGINLERLNKIIHEAAEQSNRGRVPILQEPMKFEAAIKIGRGILLDHSGETLTFNNSGNEACIFIGPEGGFSEKEVQLAQDSGLKIASLGKLTLRAETAAIVASYLATH